MARLFLALAPLLLAAPAEGAPPPLAAQFDRLLQDHDYARLATRLHAATADQAEIIPTLAWERSIFDRGAGVFVGAMYALDVLALERSAPANAERLRETGVGAALYAVAVIETDGAKCAEPTARAARQRQLLQLLAPDWAALRALPENRVPDTIAWALLREAQSAATRPPDDYLCRRITPDIPAGLALDATPIEPSYLPAEQWRPAAAAARAKLPAALTALAVQLRMPDR